MLFDLLAARSGRRYRLAGRLPGRLRGLAGAMLVGVAVGLALPAAARATPGSPAQPLLVAVFFDLADQGPAGLEAELGDGTGAPDELRIAGIPVKLGQHDGPVDAGWRTIAGAHGQYTLPLSDRLTMVNTVRLARTGFVAEDVPGEAVASAASDLRYARGGWTLALRPAMEATRWETEIVQQEPSVEGRISKSLGGGLSLASTGRYSWRRSTGGQPDVESAFGRFGLVCRLPRQMRVEMAYVVRQEAAAAVATRGTGPSVAVTMPLLDSLDLSANYDVTETVRRDRAAAAQDDRREDRHRFGLGMTWDAGEDASDLRVSAGYHYEDGSRAAGGRGDARHAGKLSLGFEF